MLPLACLAASIMPWTNPLVKPNGAWKAEYEGTDPSGLMSGMKGLSPTIPQSNERAARCRPVNAVTRDA